MAQKKDLYRKQGTKSLFLFGGQDRMPPGNLMSECAVLCSVYTAVVLFPLLLLEGGGEGMFYVDLYFKLKPHTQIEHFIY